MQLHEPTLLIIAGLPGTGKTTAIRQLLNDIQLQYIDTDRCWRELFPTPSYTPNESNSVFELLMRYVNNFLSENQSAVVEGVFASHARIIRLRRIADEHGARCVIIALEADFVTACYRMELRYRITGHAPVPFGLWTSLEEKLRDWRSKENIRWIDSSENDPKAIAAAILQVLQRS